MIRYLTILLPLIFGVASCTQAGSSKTVPPTVPHAGASGQSKHNFKVVFAFNGADGYGPETMTVSHGVLYGLTLQGGTSNSGVLYQLTADGHETVIHNFTKNEFAPEGSVLAIKGVLYGTTGGGGNHKHGTIFAIRTNGSGLWSYSFKGGYDGQLPFAGLVSVKGLLYGTTVAGGARYDGNGTVFKVTRAGKETVIYGFGNVPDGANPQAPLVGFNNVLYGTTYRGGMPNGNCGTVFSVETSGYENVLHAFNCSKNSDGSNPAAGLAVLDGILFGTTLGGGRHEAGTVFSITTDGNESVIHSFGARGDGYDPAGPLFAYNGKLYGTTAFGGAYDKGTVFEMTSGGTERLLHSFAGSDGSTPLSGLVLLGDTLYGTTANGPTTAGTGEIFSVTP